MPNTLFTLSDIWCCWKQSDPSSSQSQSSPNKSSTQALSSGNGQGWTYFRSETTPWDYICPSVFHMNVRLSFHPVDVGTVRLQSAPIAPRAKLKPYFLFPFIFILVIYGKKLMYIGTYFWLYIYENKYQFHSLFFHISLI